MPIFSSMQDDDALRMVCISSLLNSGVAVSQVTADAPDAVICTSKYSRELPYTRGRVVFAVTHDRSAFHTYR